MRDPISLVFVIKSLILEASPNNHFPIHKQLLTGACKLNASINVKQKKTCQTAVQ